MSALIVRLPAEKRARLKELARHRNVSVNKLVEEMATILLADFDAETRFRIRAARGAKQADRGRALLAKAATARTRKS
jgi:predicted DNA-binding ribbon-helix-helix protein